MTEGGNVKIAIIGGGYSGIATLANLLYFINISNTENKTFKITLLDKNTVFGGLAYGEYPMPEHIMNVPIKWIYPVSPPVLQTLGIINLEEWLNLNHKKEVGQWSREDFCPRRLYGKYLAYVIECCKKWCDKNQHQVLFEAYTNASAVDITLAEENSVKKYTIRCIKDISCVSIFDIDVNFLIYATGHTDYKNEGIRDLSSISSSKNYIYNMWQIQDKQTRLYRLINHHELCKRQIAVIGTALSGMDVLVSYYEKWRLWKEQTNKPWQGKIYLLSRHGLLHTPIFSGIENVGLDEKFHKFEQYYLSKLQNAEKSEQVAEELVIELEAILKCCESKETASLISYSCNGYRLANLLIENLLRLLKSSPKLKFRVLLAYFNHKFTDVFATGMPETTANKLAELAGQGVLEFHTGYILGVAENNNRFDLTMGQKPSEESGGKKTPMSFQQAQSIDEITCDYIIDASGETIIDEENLKNRFNLGRRENDGLTLKFDSLLDTASAYTEIKKDKNVRYLEVTDEGDFLKDANSYLPTALCVGPIRAFSVIASQGHTLSTARSIIVLRDQACKTAKTLLERSGLKNLTLPQNSEEEASSHSPLTRLWNIGPAHPVNYKEEVKEDKRLYQRYVQINLNQNLHTYNTIPYFIRTLISDYVVVSEREKEKAFLPEEIYSIIFYACNAAIARDDKHSLIIYGHRIVLAQTTLDETPVDITADIIDINRLVFDGQKHLANLKLHVFQQINLNNVTINNNTVLSIKNYFMAMKQKLTCLAKDLSIPLPRLSFQDNPQSRLTIQQYLQFLYVEPKLELSAASTEQDMPNWQQSSINFQKGHPIIITGKPGSGKTTWVKKLILEKSVLSSTVTCCIYIPLNKIPESETATVENMISYCYSKNFNIDSSRANRAIKDFIELAKGTDQVSVIFIFDNCEVLSCNKSLLSLCEVIVNDFPVIFAGMNYLSYPSSVTLKIMDLNQENINTFIENFCNYVLKEDKENIIVQQMIKSFFAMHPGLGKSYQILLWYCQYLINEIMVNRAIIKTATIPPNELLLKMPSFCGEHELLMTKFIIGLKKFYTSAVNTHVTAAATGRNLPFDELYINLAIVPTSEQQFKESNLDDSARNATLSRTDYIDQQNKIHATPQPIEIDTIFHSLSREGSNKPPHRTLVCGAPGIGKTTLLRYLPYKWALNEIWSDAYFKAVVRINLRDLPIYLSHYKSQRPESLEKVVIEIVHTNCLLDEDKEYITKEHLSKILQHYDNEILYILDGLDEVEGLLNSPSAKRKFEADVITHLLNKKLVFVSMRPYRGEEYFSRYHADQYLECIGFLDEDITNYIKNYFNDSRRRSDDESLIHLIKLVPSIKGIMHIPLNLELTCKLWEMNKVNFDDVMKFTLTYFYYQLMGDLARNYLKKEYPYVEDDFDGFPTQDCLEDFRGKVVLDFIAALAWQQMQADSLLISHQQITELLKSERFLGLQKNIKNVLKWGVLKAVESPDGNLIDNYYYFFHLTIQEFCAALWWVKQFTSQNEKDKAEAKQAFEDNKFNPRYEVVWQFVAGLLQKDEAALHEYIVLLSVKPKSFPHFVAKQSLTVRCLNECQLELRPDFKKAQLANVSSWTEEILKQGREINLKLKWLQDLEFSPAVFGQPNVAQVVAKYLTHSDRTARWNALVRLDGFGKYFLPNEVINALITIIDSHKDSHSTTSACQTTATNILRNNTRLPKEALIKLLNILKNKDPDFDDNNLQDVVSIFSVHTTMETDILVELVHLLKHPSSEIKSAAKRILGYYQSLPPFVVNEVEKMLDDQNPEIILEGVDTLSGLTSLPEPILNKYRQLLKTGTSQIKQMIAFNLDHLSEIPIDILHQLVDFITDKNISVNQGGVHTLGNRSLLPKPILDKILQIFISDEDSDALKILDNQNDLPRDIIEKLMACPDPTHSRTLSTLQNLRRRYTTHAVLNAPPTPPAATPHIAINTETPVQSLASATRTGEPRADSVGRHDTVHNFFKPSASLDKTALSEHEIIQLNHALDLSRRERLANLTANIERDEEEIDTFLQDQEDINDNDEFADKDDAEDKIVSPDQSTDSVLHGSFKRNG
jgi:uncharacterized NAD(P)/FAD-binding protein YdhS/Cdc6-like AAA superfamily ATPase